jgi:hypothetical protein
MLFSSINCEFADVVSSYTVSFQVYTKSMTYYSLNIMFVPASNVVASTVFPTNNGL